MSPSVSIGTSGWHYKHWLGKFYPDGLKPSEMLAYYTEHFGTVEINNSFYRLPTPEAVEMWRKSTPKDFCFAVKASRYLTHMKKLKSPEDALENFLPLVEKLRKKLGPILFQLPPRWRVNPERLSDFLQALPRRHRYAFELRDPSWHTPEVYKILRRHNAAFCIYELAGYQSPFEITADFAYVRLHGPDEHSYAGSYTRGALKKWAAQLKTWREEGKDSYVYFDNDQNAFAAKNAHELSKLME
jgi:uncharacterized protein YecE (DUF72 family)